MDDFEKNMKRSENPRKQDKILRLTRYILLVMVVVNTAISGKLMFQGIAPYFA